MKNLINTIGIVATVFNGMLLLSCAEKGKTGEEGIDCGAHGSAHGEHCHCNEGYFYDGATCVAPEEITDVCEEAAAVDGGEVDSEGTAETEHHHDTACVCPVDGECHCDGEISTYGGVNYCAPTLDEE